MADLIVQDDRRAARKKATHHGDADASKGETRHARESSAALREDLAKRLVALRGEFREAVANYSIRVQGLLAQTGDILLEDQTTLSASDEKLRVHALRAAIEQLEQLDLRPDKGRRRDLKRVETFVAQLCEMMSDW